MTPREAMQAALDAMEIKQRVTLWETSDDQRRYVLALRGLRAALAAEPQEPVAWQHESKECSLGAAGMHNIITTAVRDLWLRANPRQVEHYTRPLYNRPALAAEPTTTAPRDPFLSGISYPPDTCAP